MELHILSWKGGFEGWVGNLCQFANFFMKLGINPFCTSLTPFLPRKYPPPPPPPKFNQWMAWCIHHLDSISLFDKPVGIYRTKFDLNFIHHLASFKGHNHAATRPSKSMIKPLEPFEKDLSSVDLYIIKEVIRLIECVYLNILVWPSPILFIRKIQAFSNKIQIVDECFLTKYDTTFCGFQ